MEMILDTVNQNTEDVLKKFQGTEKRTWEDTETNDLIGALNKHQSETENTINREINENKMKNR
jgi:hypothetical protein